MEQQEKSRRFINLLKGVAIFLVLWGHTIQRTSLGMIDYYCNPVYRIIYSFHMPLFMLISGYLFWFSAKKRNLKDLLIHRTQSLLQPILLYSAFHAIVYHVFLAISQKSVSAFFSDSIFSIDGPWFLVSVLASSIVVGICEKVTNKWWLQLLLMAVGAVVIALFPNLNNNLYMYPYFVVGFLFSKYKERIPSKILLLKYASVVLFPVMLLFFKKDHYIYTTGIHIKDVSGWGIDLFRLAIGFVGSVFAITVLQILFELFAEKEKSPKILSACETLGVCSLQIYCLQGTFLEGIFAKIYAFVAERFFDNGALLSHTVLYSFVFTPLIAVAFAFALTYLLLLLKKAKIAPILFGR